MAPKTDQGCATPPAAAEKQIHRRLVELFAPLVYFEPEERFFPVDLPNAVRSSALWKIDPLAKPQTAQREKDFGAINAVQDLPAAGADHFTTVAGTDVIQKAVDGQPPFDMPAPRIDPIYHRYADGTLPAVLTMYATVCRARDVPNSSLLSKCSDKDVQHGMGEGLIINYYFYFPACEAPEFKSEGDWSGISLLLREAPTQLAQLASAEQLKPFLPVIACYYRKATKFAPPLPSFVAGDHGFRRWQDVRRTAEAGVGADTHPVVYISRGRHNCTYEPATTNIASSPPWEATFTADRIEGGDYAPGPAETTLQGGGIEEFPGWGYVAVSATGRHRRLRDRVRLSHAFRYVRRCPAPTRRWRTARRTTDTADCPARTARRIPSRARRRFRPRPSRSGSSSSMWTWTMRRRRRCGAMPGRGAGPRCAAMRRRGPRTPRPIGATIGARSDHHWRPGSCGISFWTGCTVATPFPT